MLAPEGVDKATDGHGRAGFEGERREKRTLAAREVDSRVVMGGLEGAEDGDAQAADGPRIPPPLERS
jgi:hypothetical protein